MNGQTPLENNVIFRTIITAMFTVLMAMGGYIATNMNKNVDRGFDAISMRIEVEAARTDRANIRLSDIEKELSVVEYRLDHPFPVR